MRRFVRGTGNWQVQVSRTVHIDVNHGTLVNPPEEWKMQGNNEYPTSLDTIADNTKKVIQVIGRKQSSINEMLSEQIRVPWSSRDHQA